MMGVGAKRALGLYRSCAPRHLIAAKYDGSKNRGEPRPTSDGEGKGSLDSDEFAA